MNRVRKVVAVFACFALGISLFSGCKKAEEQPLPSPEISAAPNFSVHRSTLDQYGLTGEIKEDGEFACAVYYPRLENQAMDAVIEEKVNSRIASFKEDASNLASQESQRPHAWLFMDFRSVQAGANGNIASIRLFGWSRKAGEEAPQYFSECLSFDIASGRQLVDGDLFADGYQQPLADLCSAALAEAYPGQEISFEGCPLDGIASRALPTASGIELYFSSSEVAAADLGILSVSLSYESLNAILSKEMQYRLSENYGQPQPRPEDNRQPFESGGRMLDPSKPMIALSFDDGPDSEVTPKILDLLRQYDARATFCVVGNRVGSRKDVVNRAVDEGNEIANHTWEHKDTNKLNIEEIKDQITRTNDIVREASGFEIRYIRPTYGNVQENLKQVSRELNMPMVNWTIDSEDWKSKNPDLIYQMIMSEARDGRVILCHDIYDTTYQAMARVIPDLIAQGYQIVTIDELFSFADSQPVGGQVWRKR